MPRQKTTFDGKFKDSPLAKNLRLLIKRQANDSVNAWVARYDGQLSQTTINRISNGTSDASIEVLLRIAEVTGYAAWQLLHPAFDPRVSPPLEDPRAMRVAAIFASIKDEKDRKRAEAIMEQFSN